MEPRESSAPGDAPMVGGSTSSNSEPQACLQPSLAWHLHGFCVGECLCGGRVDHTVTHAI